MTKIKVDRKKGDCTREVLFADLPESSCGVLGPALFLFGSVAIILIASKMR